MSKVLGGLVCVLLTACNSSDFPPANGTACQPPFVDIASSGASLEDQAILREASEDFCSVVSGENPIHAKLDTAAPVPADGGTLFYIGRKYKLTVLNSLSEFGSFSGTAHGPIITFDDSFAPGNTNEISNVRVYPSLKAPADGR